MKIFHFHGTLTLQKYCFSFDSLNKLVKLGRPWSISAVVGISREIEQGQRPLNLIKNWQAVHEGKFMYWVPSQGLDHQTGSPRHADR